MAQKRMNKRQQRLERQRRIKKKRRKRLAIILIEIVILAGLGVVAYGMFVMDINWKCIRILEIIRI